MILSRMNSAPNSNGTVISCGKFPMINNSPMPSSTAMISFTVPKILSGCDSRLSRQRLPLRWGGVVGVGVARRVKIDPINCRQTEPRNRSR